MIIDELSAKRLITPPKWMNESNLPFLAITGSVAYGVSIDDSDMDIVGFAVPSKKDIFPYSDGGHVYNFGRSPQVFQSWSEHHIKDGDKDYDFTVYSIANFFNLCMAMNPNMTDVLFSPERCILHITDVGQHIRDNRKLFLHKGAFQKFSGYSFGQMTKIRDRHGSANPRRGAEIKEFGFSVKQAYHVIRLGQECEQILVEHDLDLERNAELLKAIRRGEWSLEQIEEWFAAKQKSLDEQYNASTLQYSPDEERLKKLLLECLEMQYALQQ